MAYNYAFIRIYEIEENGKWRRASIAELIEKINAIGGKPLTDIGRSILRSTLDNIRLDDYTNIRGIEIYCTGFNVPSRGRVLFEDDLVRVFNEKGEEVYKGMEDYDPNKDLAWEYKEERNRYEYNGWIKVCTDKTF